ncbi:choline dehydrogenase [Camelus ferus]|nr:choline dehydrogenase [Camelus ferus]
MWRILQGWRRGRLCSWGALGPHWPPGIRALAVAGPRNADEYSHVVVGAGSAGCVLAGRLTEDPDRRVLLLEAGPKDLYAGSKRLLWKIHMPAALVANLCDDSCSVTAPYLLPPPVVVSKRWSTACAYLHPALSRPNLTAEAQTFVRRVLFEGTRAVGVEYVKNGQSQRAYASKEVILSGGAINSPQLLMLSGVGNADDLKKLGISVVCHLPGVGQNLQDHLEVYIQQACTRPITLHSAQKPLRKVRIGLEWLWKFTGPTVKVAAVKLGEEATLKPLGPELILKALVLGDGATAHLETGGFIRSQAGVPHPDIQFHFLPSQVIDHGRVPAQQEAYQVHVGTMRGTSVGWLKLRSANPHDHPVIQPNYLSTEADIDDFRRCVRLTREIFAQKALAPFRGQELQPGSHIQSDKEIDAFVRAKADSAYHPACTCKMGQPSDPTAVVDPQTRVLGVENLRVVDASIMPSVVSGNLNAPTIMIAEKAADIIRGRPALWDENVPVYKPRTLATQR